MPSSDAYSQFARQESCQETLREMDHICIFGPFLPYPIFVRLRLAGDQGTLKVRHRDSAPRTKPNQAAVLPGHAGGRQVPQEGQPRHLTLAFIPSLYVCLMNRLVPSLQRRMNSARGLALSTRLRARARENSINRG